MTAYGMCVCLLVTVACGGGDDDDDDDDDITFDAAPADPDARLPDAAPPPDAALTCADVTCDANATCDDSGGSAECTCNSGWTGDGTTCSDVDECTDATDDCVTEATCANNDGGFTCTCDSGYTGDGSAGGTGCTDIDECTDATDDCVVEAVCTNTPGSFMCACVAGYAGDGTSGGTGCVDIDECAMSTDDCSTITTCVNDPGSFHCDGMFVVAPYTADLRQLDPASFQTASMVEMTMTGVTITGANGLAIDPTDGSVFGIVKVSGQTGRSLVQVDLATGVLTDIGNTGDNVAGIAFDDAGQLYAVTGDGGTASETLHTVDKTSGALTSLLALGAGSDGETIGFNPVDGMIYHVSGRDTNPELAMIDPSIPSTTSITRTGFNYDEGFGMTYDPSIDGFLLFNLDQEAVRIQSDGFAEVLGAIGDGTAAPYYKGVVITAAPIPHDIMPDNGDVAGGTSVTIRGVGFNALGGAPAVTVDGVDATSIVVVDDNTITCDTPAGAGPGPIDVVVSNGSDRIHRYPGAFTYTSTLAREQGERVETDAGGCGIGSGGGGGAGAGVVLMLGLFAVMRRRRT